METIIAGLVTRFERGGLSRRELIRGIAMLAAAAGIPAAAQNQPQTGAAPGSGAAQAPATTPTGIQGNGFDHLGIQVTDLHRSLDFYTKTFGMTMVGKVDEEKGVARVGFGQKTVFQFNKQETGGEVDHVAIKMDGFNEAAVSQYLKGIGVNASRTAVAGFHIDDPDGLPIQLV